MTEKPKEIKEEKRETAKIRKVVALYDIHYPENIDLKPIERFIRNFKPTHLILGGDQMHLSCIRPYSRLEKKIIVVGEEFNRALEQLRQNFEGFNKILDEFDSCVPKDCEKIYIIGNHDWWLYKVIEKMPELKSKFDPDTNLRLTQRGYQIIPENRYYQVGKLYYIHGHYYTDMFTKKTVLAYRRNIMMGHTHTTQLYTMITPLYVGDKQSGKGVPCLCSVNPDYAIGRPNRWVNGFSIAYIFENGNFCEYTIEVTDGRFIYGGRLYGGKNNAYRNL